jgi:hypothetical protein
MAHRSPRRSHALLISAGLAAVAMLVPAATAQAGATVVRFGPFSTTFTDYVASDDCRPALSATVTGTGVVVGQIVQTPPPSSGSIFEGQDTTTLSVQFSDGSYGVGAGSFRFAGPELFAGATRLSVATYPYAESLTVYDASGQVIGTETFRSIEHYIIEDLPPFGPSDNDVVRVSVEHGRLTCNL